MTKKAYKLMQVTIEEKEDVFVARMKGFVGSVEAPKIKEIVIEKGIEEWMRLWSNIWKSTKKRNIDMTTEQISNFCKQYLFQREAERVTEGWLVTLDGRISTGDHNDGGQNSYFNTTRKNDALNYGNFVKHNRG